MSCSKCNKPNVLCKGLCQACYSKMQRNTDKGKERTKAYNLGAGKEAQIRFRERLKALKPPKPPKENCECGKPSVAKNLCANCYGKYYQRKKNGWTKKRKNKCDSSLIFNAVLSEVKKGFTINAACKNAKVDRGTLYRVISPIQKAELNAQKMLTYLGKDDDDF